MTQFKKAVPVMVLLLILAFAAAYFWVPAATPPGQKPLATLSASNFREFEVAFDEAADAPRLVLLLSPT